MPGYLFEPFLFVDRFAPFFVPFRAPFFFIGIGSTLRNVVGGAEQSRAQPLAAHDRERDPGCQGSDRAHARDFAQ